MPKRVPYEGTFELTVRCSLKCRMCLFRHDESENAELKTRELTAAQWIDMARQAAEAGTASLLITGGEPLLRPDFCEIWEGIYRQGFLITLYTNAMLVTPGIMKTLTKYPPHRIGVTIYGASPDTYEKVCGNAGAFGQVMDGIRQLQALPSILEFRTTIIQDNFTDVEAIEALVHDLAGPDAKLIQTRMVMKPVRGGCADAESCRLSPEDNIRLAFHRGIGLIKEYYGSQYDEKNLRLIRRKPGDQSSAEKISLLGCSAGMSQYTVSWDGKLLGCQLLGLFSTDALHSGLAAAWDEFPIKVNLPELDEKCKNCNMIELCNCCPASRFAETGDMGGCPEYVCEDTKIIHSLIEMGGMKH